MRLFAPVDNAFLVYFRIAFGVMMVVEVVHEFTSGNVMHVWVMPQVHFTYYGFEWVRPWPGNGMVIHFAVLGVAAVCLTLGLAYRVAAAVFFVGFTHAFLAEQTAYQNHLYLISLLSFLMVFLPAHRALSVDAWRGWVRRASTAPAWTLWLLRFQLGIVYFYGGLAKLNADWLQGEPMRLWLARRGNSALIGSFVDQEWLVYFFVYGGLLFDLLIVPLLLWRKTRPFAFGLALFFHLTNSQFFKIGIFPWFMILATALFFPPDWPRRLVERFRRSGGLRPRKRTTPKGKKPETRPGPEEVRPAAVPPRPGHRRLVLGLLGLYAALQLLVPFRHLLYPGDASWTEEGHYFAWRMMLRDKEVASQTIVVRDPATGATEPVRLRDYFEYWQAENMLESPELIRQFAHYVAAERRRDGVPGAEVYATVAVSLNGRPPQLLVDPTVNLAAQPRSLRPASWILPLEPGR